ncbi:ArsR family transcriptional regulator [Amycolatopsis sp. CA-128772]|uniref:arsenate reductase/protein-tyrosine-phosphatase family protein n=1 Tax=Amycolatopsis sp. CA-128772 TaxID=2073159 RepID=UPI000CD2F8D0|nr:ArsR family transcriptional regulator [Amycolatopsis sp. CA-128772]
MAPEPPAFVRLAAHPLRWALLTALAGGDLRVRELVALVGEPQNLVSYHLRLLREGGLVTTARSTFDGRDSYYHLDLGRCASALAAAGAALHPGLRPGTPVPGGSAVLFVCTGNSARSPIAEALLRRRSAGKVTAASAGSHPKAALHPGAVRVLSEEFGIDVARQRPRHLDTVAGHRFDHVITVCDKVREVCPEFPHHPRRRHWSIPDPAADPGSFARIAAELDTRVRHLLPELGQEARP